METFVEAKPFVKHPNYVSDRRLALEGLRAELAKGTIDEPTIGVLEQFASLPYCYTLQSCFGHFVSGTFTKDRSINRVADLVDKGAVLHYRIAYVALCIQDSESGGALHDALKGVVGVDPNYIQFGSAEWFWDICVNSYVLQVSPLRNAHEDSFIVTYDEALRIELARDRFFDEVQRVLSRFQERNRF